MDDKYFHDWFTIDKFDEENYVISEYNHWEETHCYLLNGSERSLIIDTGLGIGNIYNEIKKLTDKPVIAIATHCHWDHIGGHKHFPVFYAHKNELSWLNGKFPLSTELIKGMIVDRCKLPDGYDVNTYELFQGYPTKVLIDKETIDLGNRLIDVIHTPGHSPGSICLYEKEKGHLFVGDLAYEGMLMANFPSTDPKAYLQSLEKISKLDIKQIFPGHHNLNIHPNMIINIRDGFRQISKDGMLRHGSGTFNFGDWSVCL